MWADASSNQPVLQSTAHGRTYQAAHGGSSGANPLTEERGQLKGFAPLRRRRNFCNAKRPSVLNNIRRPAVDIVGIGKNLRYDTRL